MLSSSGRSSFAAEGDEGFSSQDNTACGEGSGAYMRTRGNIMLIQENTKRPALVCVAVMKNYVEDPKTVIGHSLQLKNATRLFFFFFDIVIYPFNMQRVPIIYITYIVT